LGFDLGCSDLPPEISESLLNTLTLSLAYEGDAHLQVYPEVEILWLDEGRKLNDRLWTEYARLRLRMYRNFFWEGLPKIDDESILLELSRRASLDIEPPPENGEERDVIFANLISAKATDDHNKWAIAIVGRNHALENDGSMRHRLEAVNIQCEVRLL